MSSNRKNKKSNFKFYYNLALWSFLFGYLFSSLIGIKKDSKADKIAEEYLKSLKSDKELSLEIDRMVEEFDSSDYYETYETGFGDAMSEFLQKNYTEEEKEYLNLLWSNLYEIKNAIDDGKNSDMSDRMIVERKLRSTGVIYEVDLYEEGLGVLREEIDSANHLSPDTVVGYKINNKDYFLVVNGKEYKIDDKKLITFVNALDYFKKGEVLETDDEYSEYINNLEVIIEQLIKNYMVDYQLIDFGTPKCYTDVTCRKLLRSLREENKSYYEVL